MTTVTVEEAQAKLPELIEKLSPGEPVLITRGARPVAQLTPVAAVGLEAVPGRCKGMLRVVAEDERHLDDFKEYMP
jgi:prevent-host-death family protein